MKTNIYNPTLIQDRYHVQTIRTPDDVEVWVIDVMNGNEVLKGRCENIENCIARLVDKCR